MAGNFDTPNNAGSGTIIPDVFGAFTDNGNNLIGIDQGSSNFVNGTNGNIVGTFATPVNPQLTALANNGGTTQTHALIAGSPAIDAGTNPNSLTTDQRGTGFARTLGSATDIGAYEFQPSNIAISTANSSQAEGNSGTTNFTFTVTRTLNTTITSTANYTVTASGANPVNATDFGGTFPSGTVSFNVGETTKTITIPVSGDNTIEPDEDFTITLSNPSSGTIISTATATGTIQNDDTIDLNISLSDAPDPITLGNPLTYILTVNNTGNADATGVEAELTLPTGVSIVGTPTVSNGFTYAGTTGGVAKFTGGSINGNSNATLTLNVTPNSAGTLTSGTAVVDPNNTITESNETNNTATAVTTTVNAPTVNLSVSSNAGTEAGTTIITITATASSAVSSNQTIDLGISGTNITAGDYNLSNTSITIPSGQTTGTTTFIIVNDALAEGTETATLTISNPSSGVALGSTTSQNIAITDNDVAGVTITQSSGSTDITEGGTTDSYTIILNSQPTNNVTININPDSQSTSSATSLTFTSANWNIPQTVTVTAVDDNLVEGNHTSTINYTASSSDPNYNGIAITPITANITDNDVATPTPTPTPTPSVTPTPNPTPTPSVTPTPIPSVTPTPIPTPTPSVTPTPIPSVTPTPIPSVTPTPIPSVTPTPIPSVTPTPTPSVTPTPTPSVTPTPTPSVTPTPTPITNNIPDDSCICDQIAYPNLNQPNSVENRIFGISKIQIGTFQNDEFLGSNTGNIVDARSGNDNLYGGDSQDILNGNYGNDFISGGNGDDILLGDENNDIILGNFGDDLIFGGKSSDSINGREDNDIVFANRNDDFIDGGKNNDTLFGGKASDTIFGSQGDDYLFGNRENDTICGGVGNDLISGNEELDVLAGCEGNDTIYGGKNNDTLTGCKGDDRLYGDLGNDSLIGGSGNDIFVLKAGHGFDIIGDFTIGQDLIGLSGLSFSQLDFTEDNRGTIIKNLLTGEQLAVMIGVGKNLITSAIFMVI